MDFDTVLEKCGSYGRYQFVLLLLYGHINILSSMHYFSQTLITFTPEHWCHHEKLENLNHSQIESVYSMVVKPSCTRLDDVLENGTAIISEFDTNCKQWIYNYDSGYQSITTELNWVCDHSFQAAVGQSFFFVGSVIGTIFFGFLADKIGRLPALIFSCLTGATGDFITSFVHSLPAFVIGRMISGFSTDTLFYLMFILVFEYLDPKKRTFGLNVITAFFYCISLMITPWLAIWVGTWRKYLLIASIPAVAVLLFPLLIGESAHWLITKEKYDRAVKCLKRVAKINGRKVDEVVFDEFVAYYKGKRLEEQKFSERKDAFIGMFRTPRLRKFTIVLLMKSMIVTLCFDIVSRNMEGFGSSSLRLFSYTSFVYAPAGFTLILLQNIIGRKGMALSCFFIGGIITAVTGFLIAFLDRDSNVILLAFMVGLGRYAGVVAYDAEAQYAAEIIPTSVRGQGISNIHVVGYACSFLSAYVIYLGNYYKPLPSIFISALMFFGAILCLYLPETLNRKLPETLNDGESFALGEKWYYFPCFSQKPREKKMKCEGNREIE